MTKAELIDALKALSNEEQRGWMFSFGYELTIYARDRYENEQSGADAKALVGFNEIQHRIYGRTASLERTEEWTEESYIEDVVHMAKAYDIEGLVVSALLKATKRTLSWKGTASAVPTQGTSVRGFSR